MADILTNSRPDADEVRAPWGLSRTKRIAGQGQATIAARRSALGAGTGMAVLLGITFPLYAEFFERRNPAWDVILGLLLVGVAVGVFFLMRFFSAHAGEIGEARFDTRNESERNG